MFLRIFRLILLAVATALLVVNFWTIDYQNLIAKDSLWAYFRIGVAVLLIVLLVRIIRSQAPHKRQR